MDRHCPICGAVEELRRSQQVRRGEDGLPVYIAWDDINQRPVPEVVLGPERYVVVHDPIAHRIGRHRDA